ncbi:MAG: hypothetical protein M1826_006272 [Phylliscum demangeonii]|nr:MAG: hypothetical protein M1826_006272 [Phylliscum demangeonii]
MSTAPAPAPPPSQQQQHHQKEIDTIKDLISQHVADPSTAMDIIAHTIKVEEARRKPPSFLPFLFLTLHPSTVRSADV